MFFSLKHFYSDSSDLRKLYKTIEVILSLYMYITCDLGIKKKKKQLFPFYCQGIVEPDFISGFYF